MPGLDVTAIDVPEDPSRTTRVTFADPASTDDRARTVHVDPYTAQVQDELVTWFGSTPAMT